MKIAVNQSQFERHHIKAGTYPGTLTAIRQGQIKAFEGDGMQDVLWWTFTVTPKKGDPVDLDGMTTMATGPKSKLRAWVTALGGDLAGTKEFDLSDLFGEACLVVVADRTKDGEAFSGIADVIASPDREDVL